MKTQYNKRHIKKTFKAGDWVYLRTQNLDTGRPSKKLDNKAIGPFMIIEVIGKQAYKLRLTPQFRLLHPTHHISMLEPYHGPHPDGTIAPDPIEINDKQEYLINHILTYKTYA